MRERVLVIDDDEALGKVVGLSLQREGFEILIATSGTDGLKTAYEAHSDLVILDVMMPRLDGWEVCRRLREMANTPVLMLTARVTETDVLKGFECGAAHLHLQRERRGLPISRAVKARVAERPYVMGSRGGAHPGGLLEHLAPPIAASGGAAAPDCYCLAARL